VAKIEDYAKTLFYRALSPTVTIPEVFFRRHELLVHLQFWVRAAVEKYGAADAVDSLKLADEIFQELQAGQAIRSIGDEIAGLYYKYFPVAGAVVRKRFLEKDKVHLRANDIGARFFPDVFDAYLGKSDSNFEIPASLIIPAADRIVSRHDNVQTFQEIELEIDALREGIHKDNVVGAEIGDDRELIEAELIAGEAVSKKSRVRLSSLLSLLLPSLRYLSDKFAGAAIGESAKRLIHLLLGLL
jgi:hypothetical protein